jgi:hypothetical protein
MTIDILVLLEVARAGALPGREFIALAEAYRAATFGDAFSGACSAPGILRASTRGVPAIGGHLCHVIPLRSRLKSTIPARK